MDTVKLGRTGLDVSRLCLGCMTYGAPDQGAHPWSMGETESRRAARGAGAGGEAPHRHGRTRGPRAVERQRVTHAHIQRRHGYGVHAYTAAYTPAVKSTP